VVSLSNYKLRVNGEKYVFTIMDSLVTQVTLKNTGENLFLTPFFLVQREQNPKRIISIESKK
jgi:hypothetical protein